MRSFNYKKSTQLLNYIASKSGGSVNKMKAIKLAWLSDRLHLRKYGRTITGDTYFAMENGPVPSGARDLVEASVFLSDKERDYSAEFLFPQGKYEFVSIKEPDMKVFSVTDIEAVDQIISEFGRYSQFELSKISHYFPEWLRFETPLLSKNASRFEMDILDFFKEPTRRFDSFREEKENLVIAENIYCRKDYQKDK